MVAGTCDNAEALREEVVEVLVPLSLRLSKEKTRVVQTACACDPEYESSGKEVCSPRVRAHRNRLGGEKNPQGSRPSRKLKRS